MLCDACNTGETQSCRPASDARGESGRPPRRAVDGGDRKLTQTPAKPTPPGSTSSAISYPAD